MIASTSVEGVTAARRPPARLTDSARWKRVLGDAVGEGSKVTSLVFLDFRALLRLGEQTGLADNRAYQRVRRDLARVRAVGATSSGDAEHTTLQIELEIP